MEMYTYGGWLIPFCPEGYECQPKPWRVVGQEVFETPKEALDAGVSRAQTTLGLLLKAGFPYGAIEVEIYKRVPHPHMGLLVWVNSRGVVVRDKRGNWKSLLDPKFPEAPEHAPDWGITVSRK